ncbi:MAG: NUDIX hydrolase [Rhodothermales bacterium]|nr:NUDIX hydrolase [Rhodothermales bacterium]
MNVRKDEVRLPNGVILPEFHVVEYPDWVSVLAVTDDRKVVLVEQYRHGVESVSLELPAGRIDRAENPESAAVRELEEETGYVADDLRLIGTCAPEPAKHNNFAHLYFSGNVKRKGIARPDASEDIQVCLLPVAELDTAINENRFIHGIHITAILWARLRGWLDQ